MSTVRILLVEDDEEQAKPFKLLLELRGYEVAWARNWSEVREVITWFAPILAIVDLYLITPDHSDGFDVIRQLRAVMPAELGILAWTANFVDARSEVLALRAGADDFVRKEADVGMIEARIEALLRRITRQP